MSIVFLLRNLALDDKSINEKSSCRFIFMALIKPLTQVVSLIIHRIFKYLMKIVLSYINKYICVSLIRLETSSLCTLEFLFLV